MKTLIFALSVAAAAVALGTPAQAQNYPWCAQYTGRGFDGAMSCGFSTYQQCMEDVSGIGGFCMRNNTYRPHGRRYYHGR